jgi:SAM-dependent methyltransferase
MSEPTTRFSDRVDAYVRSRPGYPPAVLDLLRSECGLTAASVVADVGSGTGIFTKLLLDAGCSVFAVEPNASMRVAAERSLSGYPRFHGVSGRAEATGLPDRSIDLVTATQAFHWFDRAAAKAEFGRILRPAGQAAIVWNERLKDVDRFHAEYEDLLEMWGTDYARVDHTRIEDSVLGEFFAPYPFRTARFENAQAFDFEGLKNRLLSSSYAPNLDSPSSPPMLAELERIFERHAQRGIVTMRYSTVIHHGCLRL